MLWNHEFLQILSLRWPIIKAIWNLSTTNGMTEWRCNSIWRKKVGYLMYTVGVSDSVIFSSSSANDEQTSCIALRYDAEFSSCVILVSLRAPLLRNYLGWGAGQLLQYSSTNQIHWLILGMPFPSDSILKKNLWRVSCIQSCFRKVLKFVVQLFLKINIKIIFFLYASSLCLSFRKLLKVGVFLSLWS